MRFMTAKGYDIAEINRVKNYLNKTNIVSIARRRIVSESETAEGDQLYLPPNWKKQKCEDGSSVLISSDGSELESRLVAVRHLIKTNCEPQIIYKLWNTLDTEGWLLGDELLPTGWRFRYKKKMLNFEFLDRDMNILRGTDEVINYLTENTEYNEE